MTRMSSPDDKIEKGSEVSPEVVEDGEPNRPTRPCPPPTKPTLMHNTVMDGSSPSVEHDDDSIEEVESGSAEADT